MTGMRHKAVLALCALALTTAGALAQDGKQIIGTLIQNEQNATDHRGRYMYLSVEKSDRTNGHTWTEKMAETPWGKVKYLIAEDGKPLSPERAASERARLSQEAADPAAFKRQEESRGDDEQHARQMLRLLPIAFFFDPPRLEGDTLRIPFRPNPGYAPQSLEERVLHAMAGSVLVDAKTIRLRGLEARMPVDVSIGFGLLATIKAGSNFETMRQPTEGIDWKTETVHTEINGKAMFLKTIARQQESRHSEFKKIPNDISVADAVKLLEE